MSVFLLLSVLEPFHFLIIFVVIPRLSSLKYDSNSGEISFFNIFFAHDYLRNLCD